MSHTENIDVHVNVGDGTNSVEVLDLISGKEAFESPPGSQAYTVLRKGWEPRFNSTCPPFFPSGFPCLASGVGWYLTHCFNAFVETQFSGWRYSLIFPFEKEKCSHFYVESDGLEAPRTIFHYLPGAAESSCVPVCLYSWCSPSSTVSGPGPGSLFWRHPKVLHLLSASPGYLCLPPSPCPMACFHPDSSWWGLLHAERDKNIERRSTEKPKGWLSTV